MDDISFHNSGIIMEGKEQENFQKCKECGSSPIRPDLKIDQGDDGLISQESSQKSSDRSLIQNSQAIMFVGAHPPKSEQNR